MNNRLKRIALLATFLLIVTLFAACGKDSADTSTASLAPTLSSPEPASDALAPVSLSDTQVSYEGVILEPNGDMEAVLEALGEPLSYSENISCMFEGGMDKTYEYEGVTIYSYPTETQELILLVDVTAPDVETSRGVKVGDELDVALLAYSDELTPESESRFTGVFGDVFFTIIGEEGVVTNISYELDATPVSQ